MSVIDSLTNSNFFQLKDKTASAATGDGAGNSAPKGDTMAASLAEAFMLDLSPDAREAIEQSTASNTATVAASSADEAQFALNRHQLKTIDEILAKYKDAPFTQETYEQIQDDLAAANLSPESLSLQDKIKSFNPIGILVNALSGDFSDAVADGDASLETKMDNYMAMIVDKWKNVSTTVDEAEAAEIDEDVVNAGTETT